MVAKPGAEGKLQQRVTVKGGRWAVRPVPGATGPVPDRTLVRAGMGRRVTGRRPSARQR